jgi:signal peptidase I
VNIKIYGIIINIKTDMNKYVQRKIDSLQEGKTIISKEPGNSMEPILSSREPVILTPITDWEKEVESGDIVFAKIHGTCYTHKVYGVNKDKGVLIGNNSGHMNGWTKQVYGKAHLIPREQQGDLNTYLKNFIDGKL